MTPRPVLATATVLAVLSFAAPALAQDPSVDPVDDPAALVDDTAGDLVDLGDLGDDPAADCATASEDDAGVSEDDDADEVVDDAADLRSADDGEVQDDPAAEDDPAAAEDDPATEEDGGDDPGDDDSWYCEAEDPEDGLLTGSEDVRLPLGRLMRGASVDPGAVPMPGAGVVSWRLTLRAPRAARRGHARAAAAAPKRVVLATARRTVRKGGAVHLQIRVTKAGRKALRRAGRTPALALSVRLAPKGRGAHVATHRVRVR